MCCSFIRLADWLAGWLTEWLVDQPVVRSVGRSFGWSPIHSLAHSIAPCSFANFTLAHTNIVECHKQNIDKQYLLILNIHLTLTRSLTPSPIHLTVLCLTICVCIHAGLQYLSAFFAIIVVVFVVVAVVGHLSSYIFVCRILQFQCVLLSYGCC